MSEIVLVATYVLLQRLALCLLSSLAHLQPARWKPHTSRELHSSAIPTSIPSGRP
jgi:hypothetical protein